MGEIAITYQCFVTPEVFRPENPSQEPVNRVWKMLILMRMPSHRDQWDRETCNFDTSLLNVSFTTEWENPWLKAAPRLQTTRGRVPTIRLRHNSLWSPKR